MSSFNDYEYNDLEFWIQITCSNCDERFGRQITDDYEEVECRECGHTFVMNTNISVEE